MIARKGRTLITENAIGLVQAAAGVDGSNVESAELVLLPVAPDASAAALRSALKERLGVNVGVLITDTMGRAWRNGQIDVTIGAAGLHVPRLRGNTDRHGNDLIVTEIAVADELAAAADLVKGKFGDVPVAVVSGLALQDDGSTARTWCGPARGSVLARCEGSPRAGTQQALLRRVGARLLRRTRRARTRRGRRRRRVTAPAPHHTRPVRFVWLRDPNVRRTLLDAMRDKWRADLARDGATPERIETRVRRGDILYRAPEVVIPFWVPDGAHTYQDAGRPRSDNVHRRGGCRRAGVTGRTGDRWRGQLLDRIDDIRAGHRPRGAGAARGLGTPGRHCHRLPDEPSGPRDPVPTADLLVRR